MRKHPLKTESGRTMVETIGVLIILIILTIGGVHLWGLAHANAIANNLIDAVLEAAINRQNELLAVRKAPVSADSITSPGPHNVSLTVENGVTENLKDVFWVSLSTVSQRICELLLEKKQRLQSNRMPLLAITVDGSILSDAEQICTEENLIRFVFGRDENIGSDFLIVTPIPGDPDSPSCPPKLCPTGASCTESSIICMPGYKMINEGICAVTCEACTGNTVNNRNDAHNSECSPCPSGKITTDHKTCKCTGNGSRCDLGGGAIGYVSNCECVECLKDAHCTDTCFTCEDNICREVEFGQQCDDCVEPQACWDDINHKCIPCEEPCQNNKDCRGCETCGLDGRCHVVLNCPQSCTTTEECGKCQNCTGNVCVEIPDTSTACPDCPEETPCWDNINHKCIPCERPCPRGNKDCLSCETCGLDGYCHATQNCPQSCTTTEDCGKCQNCEDSICVEIDNAECPDCPEETLCWDKENQICIECVYTCGPEHPCPANEMCNEEHMCVPCDTANNYYSEEGSTECTLCPMNLIEYEEAESGKSLLVCPLCTQAMIEAGFTLGEIGQSDTFLSDGRTIIYTGNMTVNTGIDLGHCNLQVNGKLTVNSGKFLKTTGAISVSSGTNQSLVNNGTVTASQIALDATNTSGVRYGILQNTGDLNADSLSITLNPPSSGSDSFSSSTGIQNYSGNIIIKDTCLIDNLSAGMNNSDDRRIPIDIRENGKLTASSIQINNTNHPCIYASASSIEADSLLSNCTTITLSSSQIKTNELTLNPNPTTYPNDALSLTGTSSVIELNTDHGRGITVNGQVKLNDNQNTQLIQNKGNITIVANQKNQYALFNYGGSIISNGTITITSYNEVLNGRNGYTSGKIEAESLIVTSESSDALINWQEISVTSLLSATTNTTDLPYDTGDNTVYHAALLNRGSISADRIFAYMEGCPNCSQQWTMAYQGGLYTKGPVTASNIYAYYGGDAGGEGGNAIYVAKAGVITVDNGITARSPRASAVHINGQIITDSLRIISANGSSLYITNNGSLTADYIGIKQTKSYDIVTIGEGRSIQLRHPSSVHDSALVIQVDNSDDEGYLYLGKNASIGLARILAFSTTLDDPPVHCTTSITSTTCSYPIPSKVLIDQDIPEKLKPWGLWGEDSYY